MSVIYLWGDFNGHFDDVLCLSHDDQIRLFDGTKIKAVEGVKAKAVENDDGEYLVASGIIEPSPPELQCNGSTWCLRIDARGCRHENDYTTSN